MTTIYHNPRCSKSRATLEILVNNGINPEIVLYLENPLDVDTLKGITDMLDCSIKHIMRTGESEYKELALNNPDLSDNQLLAAVADHPKLLERPIIVNNGKATIGRPPENVLKII